MQNSGAHALTSVIVDASESERRRFLKRVYGHLAGATVGFVLLEAALQALPFSRELADRMVASGVSWLLVILGFWALGALAARWAGPDMPLSRQYLGLGLYTLGQAIIFLPMIAYARRYDPDAIAIAGLLTLAVGVGLSLIALDPSTSFGFLRGAIIVGGVLSLGIIVVALLFGLSLGVWFSLAMIVFFAGSILYQTDDLTRTARTDGYVAGALALFASFMGMLWYILRLVLSQRR
jgi:FtsH-binding integral membrane protein